MKDDKLYLLYTGHVDDEEKREETQCLAVSTDGITFEKLPTNPVIHAQHIEGIADIADFRDPKVFEYQGSYYAVVASKTPDDRGHLPFCPQVKRRTKTKVTNPWTRSRWR